MPASYHQVLKLKQTPVIIKLFSCCSQGSDSKSSQRPDSESSQGSDNKSGDRVLHYWTFALSVPSAIHGALRYAKGNDMSWGTEAKDSDGVWQFYPPKKKASDPDVEARVVYKVPTSISQKDQDTLERLGQTLNDSVVRPKWDPDEWATWSAKLLSRCDFPSAKNELLRRVKQSATALTEPGAEFASCSAKLMPNEEGRCAAHSERRDKGSCHASLILSDQVCPITQ